MKQKQREIFADILRTFAIFFVLIIHCTSNFFVESYGTKTFSIVLAISSITSCAVPLFYMLSGCFLINKNNLDYAKFYKKILKVFLQTIFWTLVYLLIFKIVMHQDINIIKSMFTSFFKEQVGHLWFMYPLISLYILTPFISKLYFSSNKYEKRLFLVIILIVPILLNTLQLKFWDIISIPKFSIFFPELGLFILGKYLYDYREQLQSKKITFISFLSTIIAIIMIIIFAKIIIYNQGISNIKPYFDSTMLPNFFLDTSLFIFMLSINNYLVKLPDFIKHFFSLIASNTSGIYFLHMIFIYVFPTIKLFGIYFTANSGNLINMLLGSILYFVITFIIVLIIKKIPYLNKTI